MRIGLCYDLAADWAVEGFDAEATAEFDRIETVEAVEAVLAARGHAVTRIGRAQQLVRLLADGARWDLVFNICEGLHGLGRESLVPALLDTYAVSYVFSDPEVLALALHKAHCKRVVRDAGVPTAEFRVIDDAGQTGDLPWPVFVKPLAEGTGKGIGNASLCRSPEELAATAGRIIARFNQPAIAEAWLPGREFTVGVIGSGASARLLGVMEIRSDATYGLDAKKHFDRITYRRTPDLEGVAVGSAASLVYRLVTDTEAMAAGAAALAAWRVLGGRDGGRIDLRSDAAGRPMFLEANPLPGLHPTDSDLTIMARLAGHDHAWLLTQILDAACARLGLTW